MALVANSVLTPANGYIAIVEVPNHEASRKGKVIAIPSEGGNPKIDSIVHYHGPSHRIHCDHALNKAGIYIISKSSIIAYEEAP